MGDTIEQVKKKTTFIRQFIAKSKEMAKTNQNYSPNIKPILKKRKKYKKKTLTVSDPFNFHTEKRVR